MRLIHSEKIQSGSIIVFSNKYITEDGVLLMDILYNPSKDAIKASIETREFMSRAFTENQKRILLKESYDFCDNKYEFIEREEFSEFLINLVVRKIKVEVKNNLQLEFTVIDRDEIKERINNEIRNSIEIELTKKCK